MTKDERQRHNEEVARLTAHQKDWRDPSRAPFVSMNISKFLKKRNIALKTVKTLEESIRVQTAQLAQARAEFKKLDERFHILNS